MNHAARLSHALPLVFGLCLLVPSYSSADIFGFTESPREDGNPISELPTDVRVEAGRFSAWAAFDRPQTAKHVGTYVPLYLINDTNEPIILSRQDASAYFFLEVEVNDQWARAEPFEFSWCGNSYGKLQIGPRHFLVSRGGLPSQGTTESRARFRRVVNLDSPVVSNVGATKFSMTDVKAARLDAIEISEVVDAGTLLAILNDEMKPSHDGYGTSDHFVMAALGARFPKRAIQYARSLDEATLNDTYGIDWMLSNVVGQVEKHDLAHYVKEGFGTASTALEAEAHLSAVRMLSMRFPDAAKQWADTESAAGRLSPDEATEVIEGLREQSDPTFAQLMGCLDLAIKHLPLEEPTEDDQETLPWISRQIVRGLCERHSVQLMAERERFVREHHQIGRQVAAFIEMSAFDQLPPSELAALLAGETPIYGDVDSILSLIRFELAVIHPDAARRLVDKWSKSDQQNLRKTAGELQRLLDDYAFEQ